MTHQRTNFIVKFLLKTWTVLYVFLLNVPLHVVSLYFILDNLLNVAKNYVLVSKNGMILAIFSTKCLAA